MRNVGTCPTPSNTVLLASRLSQSKPSRQRPFKLSQPRLGATPLAPCVGLPEGTTRLDSFCPAKGRFATSPRFLTWNAFLKHSNSLSLNPKPGGGSRRKTETDLRGKRPSGHLGSLPSLGPETAQVVLFPSLRCRRNEGLLASQMGIPCGGKIGTVSSGSAPFPDQICPKFPGVFLHPDSVDQEFKDKILFLIEFRQEYVSTPPHRGCRKISSSPSAFRITSVFVIVFWLSNRKLWAIQL